MNSIAGGSSLTWIQFRNRGMMTICHTKRMIQGGRKTCFQYGHPFGPLYRCPTRKLQVLNREEDGGQIPEGEIEAAKFKEPSVSID